MKTKGKPESKEEWVGEERQRQSKKARWSRQREEINKRQDKGEEMVRVVRGEETQRNTAAKSAKSLWREKRNAQSYQLLIYDFSLSIIKLILPYFWLM